MGHRSACPHSTGSMHSVLDRLKSAINHTDSSVGNMLSTIFSVGNAMCSRYVYVLHQQLATLFVDIWHLKNRSAGGRPMSNWPSI